MRAPFCLALAAVIVLASPAMAAPKIVWDIYEREGQTYLEGMVDESEVDNEFWARCGKDGLIDIGMGAESHVGKGKGEKVSLTLTSGGQSVTIAGVSRESVNVEMTGGIELQARVKRDDKLFAILATGQPIRVTGSIRKPLRWDVKGLKAKVAEFFKLCGKQGR
jgi:hypothetical protein